MDSSDVKGVLQLITQADSFIYIVKGEQVFDSLKSLTFEKYLVNSNLNIIEINQMQFNLFVSSPQLKMSKNNFSFLDLVNYPINLIKNDIYSLQQVGACPVFNKSKIGDIYYKIERPYLILTKFKLNF